MDGEIRSGKKRSSGTILDSGDEVYINDIMFNAILDNEGLAGIF
jgi:hypothetical protein